MSKKRPKKKIVFSDIDSLSSSTDDDDRDEVHETDLSNSIGASSDHGKSDTYQPRKITGNQIFKELIVSQIDNVIPEWKLNISDMKRICKYINTSIFDDNTCCLWKGYITNLNNSTKGTYINFYFRNKKVALHRLLYNNYVESLDNSEYLKFKCVNKGICCNVNHYEKYKYSKNTDIIVKVKPKKKSKKEMSKITIVSSDDPDSLVIDFE